MSFTRGPGKRETHWWKKLPNQRGRAPRGQRLIGRVPWGHWKTTTFIAGLRHDRVVAPLVLDGAMNGPAFRAYVEQFLVPTLARGDIVIADNLASRKVAVVRDVTASAIAPHRSDRRYPAVH